jgi:hypothetical protein
MNMDRRDFLKLMGMGSAVLVMGSRTSAGAAEMKAGQDDFMFVQLSDTHWGFNGPAVNPDATGTLKKAIAAVNNMKECFGNTRYTFDHKGVHFIVLDNVSDPTSSIGDVQLLWLNNELKKVDVNSRIIVLTHRPLFDLYPNWDWWTRDGAKAIDLLMPYKNVTVFYGHIHQEHHQMTGHIPHHAAKGLMFPLPAPGSVPKRVPIPWDPSTPYKGLGYRGVQARADKSEYMITEYPLQKG